MEFIPTFINPKRRPLEAQTIDSKLYFTKSQFKKPIQRGIYRTLLLLNRRFRVMNVTVSFKFMYNVYYDLGVVGHVDSVVISPIINAPSSRSRCEVSWGPHYCPLPPSPS